MIPSLDCSHSGWPTNYSRRLIGAATGISFEMPVAFFFGAIIDDSIFPNLYNTAMKIIELLLNGNNFSELLSQFSIDVKNVRIQDEEIILSDQNLEHRAIDKENICIEGRNNEGSTVNFFGTLHWNLWNKLAVFEMQGFEKLPATTATR